MRKIIIVIVEQQSQDTLLFLKQISMIKPETNPMLAKKIEPHNDASNMSKSITSKVI